MTRAGFSPSFGWLQFSHLWLISKQGCVLLHTMYYKLLIVDLVNNRRQQVKRISDIFGNAQE